MRVRLTAKTNKGKTRLGNSGSLWNVDAQASEHLTPRPVEILIRSLNGKDCRWIHPTDDPNFTIVEFIEHTPEIV